MADQAVIDCSRPSDVDETARLARLFDDPSTPPLHPVPRTLVTLLDIMNHYNVWQLVLNLKSVRETRDMLLFMIREGQGSTQVPPSQVDRISGFAALWLDQFNRLELHGAASKTSHTLIRLRGGMSAVALETELRVLSEIVADELKLRRFAFVPTAKAITLDDAANEWKAVWDKLPSTQKDSRSAVECYALDPNDACLFHLMRVVEYGLRIIARKFKVALAHKGKNLPIEDAEWDKLITGIKQAIETARQQLRGPRRTAQLSLYSEVMDHCIYLKELRNAVSHTRKSYNDLEALNAIRQVRNFMVLVASGLPKPA